MGGIRLTTPKDAGDLDVGDYTDIRVTQVNWNLVADEITALYQLGSFNDTTGKFTAGVLPPQTYILHDFMNPDGTPHPTHTDYTDFFEDKNKQGPDSNAERWLELLTDIMSQRLGLAGTATKPGRGGKKKV